jgi:hypothetical protein
MDILAPRGKFASRSTVLAIIILDRQVKKKQCIPVYSLDACARKNYSENIRAAAVWQLAFLY